MFLDFPLWIIVELWTIFSKSSNEMHSFSFPKMNENFSEDSETNQPRGNPLPPSASICKFMAGNLLRKNILEPKKHGKANYTEDSDLGFILQMTNYKMLLD